MALRQFMRSIILGIKMPELSKDSERAIRAFGHYLCAPQREIEFWINQWKLSTLTKTEPKQDEMKASENKFLKVAEGVVLTATIEPVIVALDKYFEAANHVAYVSSGLRNPTSQLNAIRKYLRVNGLDQKYPIAMACMVEERITWGGRDLYAWQPAWSKLLNIGVIINPPMKAEVLFDYYHPKDPKTNRKGKMINGSPHFVGKAFDIGGKMGEDVTIKDELPIIERAFKDRVPGMVGYLPEHGNNCIHVDCVKV